MVTPVNVLDIATTHRASALVRVSTSLITAFPHWRGSEGL